VLSLFGLPVGRDMDGRPWLEIMESPPSIKPIESWESVSGESGQHAEDIRENPAEAAEMVRRLVELGYVEPPGEDAEDSIRRVLRDRKLNLAVALTASRRASKAVPIWQELVKQYPDEHGFRIQLASCLIRVGRVAECKAALSTLDEQSSQSPYVQLMQATIDIDEGWPAVALRRLHEVLASDPTDTSILNRVGALMLRTDEWSEAARIYQRSLEMRSDNSVAHVGLAQVFIRRKQFEDAAEHALTAVGLTHVYPAAHYYLGVALNGCQRTRDAKAAFETARAMGYPSKEIDEYLAPDGD